MAACLAVLAGPPSRSETHRELGSSEPPSGSRGVSARWAVVVGVDQYQDPEIARLEGAVADATAIAKALVRYAAFPPQQVFSLTSTASEKPTGAAILDTLNEVKHAVKPGDLLLFFFAGHGVEMEGQRYLLTYDASYQSAGTLKQTTLSASRLMQDLESIPVTHRIVMIDACRDDPINPRRAPLVKAATAALESLFTLQPSTEEGARANFLSSRRGQAAYEWREKGRGFFSYFIEQGLSGEAAVRGRVTLSSLYGYLNEFVPRAVRAQRGKEQMPFGKIEGEDLVLVEGVAPERSLVAAMAQASAGPATRTVFGVVKDSDGRPLPNTRVRVALAAASSRGLWDGRGETAGLVATADEDGFFKVEVPHDASVTVTAGGEGGFGTFSVASSPADSGKKLSLFLPRSRVPAAGGAQPASSADANAMELARVAYQSFLAEEFTAAERAARSALGVDPRNALAHAVMANCLAVDGVNRRDAAKLASARRWADPVLKAEPRMALAHNAIGLVLYGSGDLRGAQRAFLSARQFDPGLSLASANLGQVFLMLGQHADAERAFSDAIRGRPEAALPYNGLAQVFLARGRAREATQASLEAISRYELQDDYLGLLYVNLAAALHQAGRARPAFEAVARARSLGVSRNPTVEMIEREATTRRR